MRLAILSSSGECGVHEYSKILQDGFERLGHDVGYYGVPHYDDRALVGAVRAIREPLVVIEYEPGIFRLPTLVLAMLYLRLRRRRIMLSVHEIGPEKFPQPIHIGTRLRDGVRFEGPLELLRIGALAGEVGLRYGYHRALLYLLGALPQRIVLHSPLAREQIVIAVPPHSPRLAYVPHLILARDPDVDALRASLGLPRERFILTIPGFIFRRKRIVEVIERLPDGVTLLVAGTRSRFDEGYIDEVRAAIAARPDRDIRLIESYERMEDYLNAADAAILYYRDGFQSGIAALALGAGKPVIFSDIPAFHDYAPAGLLVRDGEQLATAMDEIRRPELYARLRAGALRLRERYAPERIAAAYLDPTGATV